MTGMKKKTCCRCRRKRLVRYFAWTSTAKTKRQAYCLDCGREYHKEWYARHRAQARERMNARTREVRQENREKLLAYLLAHPCVDCGETDPRCLDFDHVRGEKRRNVANLMERPWTTIETEIAKCDVRCANCHRKRTATQFGWFKDQRAAA
jgi:hypothetical protein